MSNHNDPINPIENPDLWHVGLTKREYFACQAMRALISTHSFTGSKDDREICIKASINYANGLLKELEK